MEETPLVCKLVLLGNGSAGKTSICNRFKSDGFERVYKQTVGLDWYEKRGLRIRDKSIILQVWDIGGQSLSNNKLLSTYISGASVVFLVYDVTDAQSFKDVSDWLQLMRRAFTTTVTPTSASAAHSPSVYLCGNKIDLEHLRKVSQLEHERFVADNALQGGFFVSARSGEHVLTSFYQAAAAQLGFTLTPEELEQTQKVLAVTVQGRADNEARTVDAEQIEREDAAAELAKQKEYGAAVVNEANTLVAAVRDALRASLDAKATSGSYDFMAASRQVMRLNAVFALKYQLSDDDWAYFSKCLMTLLLANNIEVPRQTSYMQLLTKLLKKKRDRLLLTLEWRPLWDLFVSMYGLETHTAARAAEPLRGAHAMALSGLIRAASRYFAPSSVADIVALAAPGLTHQHAYVPFVSAALLYEFLPPWTRLDDLPAGTAEGWLRAWSHIEHCGHWDGCWAAVFGRLAHPDRIGAHTGPAAGWSWGAAVPFFFARLQAALNLPVAGGAPSPTATAPLASALTCGAEPAATGQLVKLLVRLTTVPMPPPTLEGHGDDATLPPGIGMTAAAARKAAEAANGAAEAVVPAKGVGDGSPMGYWERLLRATATYFYPTSSHAGFFASLLRAISARFMKRIGREAGALQAAFASPNPPAGAAGSGLLVGHYHGLGGALTAAHITRFVDAALPLAVLGMYAPRSGGGKATVIEATRCMRSLASVAPARVTAAVVSFAMAALDPGAVNATHHAPNALLVLAGVTRRLLWPVPHLAPALPRLLELALPGLDPNDLNKTEAALQFFQAVMECVPLLHLDDIPAYSDDAVDLPAWHPASPARSLPGAAAPGLPTGPAAGVVTALGPGDRPSDAAGAGPAPHEYDAPTPNDEDMDGVAPASAATAGSTTEVDEAVKALFLAARDATSRLGDWAMQFLDRCLALVETREKPAKAKHGAGRGGGGGGLGAIMMGMAGGKSDQVGPLLGNAMRTFWYAQGPALRAAATERLQRWLRGLSPLEFVKDVSTLLATSSRGRADIATAIVPRHAAAALAPGASTRVIAWHCAILRGVVRGGSGARLLPYAAQLTEVIATAFASEDKTVRKAGGKLLRAVLVACTHVSAEFSSFTSNVNLDDAASRAGAWKRWGEPVIPTGSDFVPSMKWDKPSDADRAAALAMINTFLVGPMTRLSALVAPGDGSGPAALPPSIPAAAAASGAKPFTPAEQIRVDLEVVNAVIRGAAACLTDHASASGDDDVIYNGTTGKALAWDHKATVAVFATTGTEAAGLAPLRYHLACLISAVADYLGKGASTTSASSSSESPASAPIISSQPATDTRAIGLALKVASRLIIGRAAKMSKTRALADMLRHIKSQELSALDKKRASVFRSLRKVAGSTAAHVTSSAADSTAWTKSGSLHSTVYIQCRALLLCRRRLAEAIYALPRAVHSGVRNPASIGDSNYEHSHGDEDDAAIAEPPSESGGGGDGKEQDETAEADEFFDAQGDAEMDLDPAAEGPQPLFSPLAAVTPSPASASGQTAFPFTEAVPRTAQHAQAIRRVTETFGKGPSSRLPSAELGYALLLSSVVRLTRHSYDDVRRRAGSHIPTLFSVVGWMRRPAIIAAMQALTRGADALIAAGGSPSKAPAFRGGVPTLPKGILAMKMLAEAGGIGGQLPDMLKAALATAMSSGDSPEKVLAALSQHPQAAAILSQLAGMQLSPSATPGAAPPTALASASEESSSRASPAASSAFRPQTPQLGKSKQVAPEWYEVLGHFMVAFAANPRALVGDWSLIDRTMRVLLRGADMVGLLPPERQAVATQAFSVASVQTVQLWHAVPIAVFGKWAAKARATRDALIQHMLRVACPAAFGSSGSAPTTASPPIPLVTNADGSRSPSAAPYPTSSVHWRTELLAGAFMCILLAPPRNIPRHNGSNSSALADPIDLFDAPEEVWLWALSNMLSADAGVKQQALDLVILLLHRRQQASQRLGGTALPIALPRVTSTFANPSFVSQFVMAIVELHKPQHGEDGQQHGMAGRINDLISGSGFGQFMRPLHTVRHFPEVARWSLQGGAISQLQHALLFELLADVFPAVVDPIVTALAQLVPATASAVSASEKQDLDVQMVPSSDVNSTPSASTTKQEAGHDVSSLRVRRATVAEAFGGFLRSFSRTAVTSPGAVGECTTISPAHASLPAAIASVGADPGSAITGRLLAVAAPIIESLSLDHISDWSNMLRFALIERHPAQVMLVLRWVFANAGVALASTTGDALPQGLDAAVLSKLLSGVDSGKFASEASAAVSSGSSATTQSFASVTKWLDLSSAFIAEMLVASPADGVQGFCPGYDVQSYEAELFPSLPISAAVDKGQGTPRTAMSAISRQLVPLLIRALSHRYESVRDEVALVLSMITDWTWAPVDNNPAASSAVMTQLSPVSVGRQQWLPSVVASVVYLAMAGTTTGSVIGSTEGSATASEETRVGYRATHTAMVYARQMAGGDPITSAQVLLCLLAAMSAAQHHPDAEVSNSASHALKCTAQKLGFVRVSAADCAADIQVYSNTEQLYNSAVAINSDTSSLPSPLPPRSGRIESGYQLAAHVLATCATVGIGPGATADKEEAVDAASAARSKANWYIRRSVAEFLVPFRARALLALSRSEDAALLAIADRLLRDRQAEVQAAAQETLIGFIITMPPKLQSQIGDRYLATAGGAKLPPKRAMPLPDAPQVEMEAYKTYKSRLGKLLAVRHAGVLGAGAVVQAHPFDVPSFLPPLLSALSRFGNDPAPVGKSAKALFAEFKRTHLPDWELHRMAFTTDQLADLSDMLSSGHYYA